jgi:O-antigen/teichoic acid export membrane protein
MSQPLLSQDLESIKLQTLAKDTTVAIIIQVGGRAVTYLSVVFLAQWMGETEYGIYEYVISWSLLLAIVAGIGYPRTVLRFVVEYRIKQDWGRLRGIVRSSWLIIVLAGLLISVVGTGAIWLLNHYHSFTYATPLLIGIWLVPLQALVYLQLETMRAMEDITLAYIPSQIIWPVLMLCGGFLLLKKNHSLTSVPMISMATLVLLPVVLFQLWLLWNKLNKEVKPATPVYAHREWFGVSLVLLLQYAFASILSQTDILMIGSIMGPSEAGIYSAAVKTAMWANVILQTVNMAAAPMFTTLYTQGDLQGLQKVISIVTLWIFWPTLAIVFILVVFAKPILGIFGSEFVAGSSVLKILVLGQMINALCGSVNILMTMTGHQNKSVVVFGCTALINLVLNAFAIPFLGAVGASIATAFAMMVWNIWLSVLVVRNVGVNPSVFSLLLSHKNDSKLSSEA